ncbi:MAG TPA: M14 family zinc carboxypeptidase [Capillimicrobium sp.]|nr:M14 family zinc carboxypeptidase [Capillimicrobium sp.]
MIRPALGTAAALAGLAVLAPGALGAPAPAALPKVERQLAAGADGCATTTYTAPISGFLDTRLDAGGGDWDLLLRDGETESPLKSSRGFAAHEVIQGFVTAGQELIAEACRQSGSAEVATVTFELLDVAPPAAGATPSLVRVQAGPEMVERMEEAGLDVTHNVRDGHADVVVRGAAQLDLLRSAGLPFTTRIADLGASYAAARRADAAYAEAVDGESPLPSGSVGYRDLDAIQAELKQLVDEHPDRVRPVVIGRSFQGREISGVEIADDVDRHDGRPTFFLMGVHHAREWPSAEAAMEFAHLLVKEAADPRIAAILRDERVVIVPVVNVDGYVSSRESESIDPAILLRDNAFGGDEDPLGTGLPLATVESVVPPGGILTYRRKNCDGAIPSASVPCFLQHGVDNNRNYGNLWGGSGASPDPTSQSYHGPGPRSEPETQAVWDYARTHQVTMLMTLHNVAGLVLRPPGLAESGQAPDEARMKQIGDAMAAATGYTSQYSFQLYDTAGTTEDDTYAATGGYGYTIEIGPSDGAFHEPYQRGFVDEWTGAAAGKPGQGLREALLLAAEGAASVSDHAVLRGTAPPGRVLRLHKSFVTETSAWCRLGIDPVVSLLEEPVCLGPEQEPIELQDELDTTTTVPASGAFEWHVNPSTRPFVGGGAVIEHLDEQPYASEQSGPTGDGRVPFDVTEADATGAVKVTLAPTIALEDYDLEVYRVEDDGSETQVASSGNPPGAATEEVVLTKPEPGRYVAKVVEFAAVTGQWTLTVEHFKTTREVTTGTKEAYELTCETADGTVLERHDVVVDRGQVLDLSLPCGSTGGGAGGGGGTAPPPAPPADGTVADATPMVDGTPVAAAGQSTTAASTNAARPSGARPGAAKGKPGATAKAKARRAKCRAKAERIAKPAKRKAALRRCRRL